MIKMNSDRRAICTGVDFQASAASHAGARRRNNQDRYFVGRLQRSSDTIIEGDAVDLQQDEQESSEKPEFNYSGGTGAILIVADGVGGNVAGDVAAELAIASFVEFLGGQTDEAYADAKQAVYWENLLQRAIQHCQSRVLEYQHAFPNCDGMGTTFTACILVGSRAYIVHAGDSRAYLSRGRNLIQLTVDQTFTQKMVEEGGMTLRQASKSPLSHCIWSSLGGKEPSLEPQVFCLDIQEHDKILLCSDGLTNELARGDLRRLLGGDKHVVQRCKEMIEQALRNGGRDNITVVVGEFRSIDNESTVVQEYPASLHNLSRF